MSRRTIKPPFFIKRIYVDRLFGQYTYDLSTNPHTQEKLSRLLILYGDNGSGKTTILRLVFNLLGFESGRGQKSFLAQTLFRQVKVEFSDGTTVVAARGEDSFLGSFKMSVLKRHKVLAQINWKVGETLLIKNTEQDQRRQSHMFKTLERMNLNLYFLMDDRRIFRIPQSGEKAEAYEYSLRQQRSTLLHSTPRATVRKRSEEGSREKGLEAALGRVSQWATNKALQGATKGDLDSNTLYEETVRRLGKPVDGATPESSPATRETLIQELQTQANRSEHYSRFGLISPIPVVSFVSVLREADPKMLQTLQHVLNPYIESIRARLDALEPLHDAINSFLTLMNGFYRDKAISFDLERGISLQAKSGTAIPPTALSSGERQLLMLFCNVLVAMERRSVFIIDEPELSLNIKWQRRLIDALLEFTKGSSLQFVLATHSIELLSRYDEHVMKLDVDSDH